MEGRRLGVEPICAVLQVASSTYYAARDRAPSARAQRDAELTPRLVELWKANYEVYGSRKLWKAARRAGIDVGRDQTRRLMAKAGIQGALRSKRVRTTRRDRSAGRHPDLVKRQFRADEPNQLWVTDLTFVATWAGVAYVCFIVDAFSRMIVGWRVAGHMRTPMVLDAIEMARWNRGLRHDDLRCHSDAWSANSPPFATASASPRSAPRRRSAPSATRSTTPWRKRSTATTRPSPSAAGPARGRGRRSRRSKPPHWGGCTGTTPSGCTATSAISRLPSSSNSTAPAGRPIRGCYRSRSRLPGPQKGSTAPPRRGRGPDHRRRTPQGHSEDRDHRDRRRPDAGKRRPGQSNRSLTSTSTSKTAVSVNASTPTTARLHPRPPHHKTPEPPSNPGRFRGLS